MKRNILFFVDVLCTLPMTLLSNKIEYACSALAAMIYGKLFSRYTSGGMKETIAGGLMTELLIQVLGRASFFPDKFKKGKMLFYKFFVPPIALCWLIKEWYSFTKELLTPQQSLEFDGNQIKNPTQYLFYLNTSIEVILGEIAKHDYSLLANCWKFYNDTTNKKNITASNVKEKEKIPIQAFLNQISNFDKNLYNVVKGSFFLETNRAKKVKIANFFDFFEKYIRKYYEEGILVKGEKNGEEESNFKKIDDQMKQIGELLQSISIEECDQKVGNEGDIEKYFHLKVNNNQIKNALYYLIYLSLILRDHRIEYYTRYARLPDRGSKYKFYNNKNNNSVDEAGKESIQTFLQKVHDRYEVLYEAVVNKLFHDINSKTVIDQPLDKFLLSFEACIHKEEFCFYDIKKNNIIFRIKTIGDMLKNISIESSDEPNLAQEKLFRKEFDAKIDYIIAFWRKNIFLAMYHKRNNLSYNNVWSNNLDLAAYQIVFEAAKEITFDSALYVMLTHFLL